MKLCAVALLACAGSAALAGNILVVGESTSDTWALAVKGHLNAFGDTATISATVPGSLSGYDQVWDVRWNTAISSSDKSAFGTYLADGGRMFVIGETPALATRDNSVLSFLHDTGAGTLTLDSATLVGTQSQTVTTAGQIVNHPNSFTDVYFSGAGAVTNAGNGFLVTQIAPGKGSIVGWDFGDISGKSQARMLACFDTQVLSNLSGWSATDARNWTRNMRDYLNAPLVPLPTTAGLAAAGLLLIAGARRRFS